MMHRGWARSGQASRGGRICNAEGEHSSASGLAPERRAAAELGQGERLFLSSHSAHAIQNPHSRQYLKTNTHTFPRAIYLSERQIWVLWEETDKRSGWIASPPLKSCGFLVCVCVFGGSCGNLSHPRMRKLDRGQSPHLLHHENLLDIALAKTEIILFFKTVFQNCRPSFPPLCPLLKYCLWLREDDNKSVFQIKLELGMEWPWNQKQHRQDCQ